MKSNSTASFSSGVVDSIKRHYSVSTKYAFVIAVLIWFALTGFLDANIYNSVGFGAQVGLYFLIGYTVISLWRHETRPYIVVLATVLGFEIVTSIYALTRFAGSQSLHLILVLIGAVFGSYRLAQFFRSSQRQRSGAAELMLENHALWAGIIVMVTVGSAFYFSGRPDGSGLVFYGPMARDHIFHLALIERLDYVVPPDNFVVAGYPFPSYHFFNDVTQVLLRQGPWQSGSKLDIYYRLYPAAFFFAVGFLAFLVPARIFASRLAGAIGAAIILFGADFSWMLGLLQTLKALPNPALAEQKLLEPWIFFATFNSLYPLVHRPAYYNGLLIFLAGLACVSGRAGKTTSSWITAGVIWGLMAGFNYTIAATLGSAIACSAGLFFAVGDRIRARHLLSCAASLAITSIPASLFVLSQIPVGNYENGRVITFDPGALAVETYGRLLGATSKPGLFISLCSMVIFVFVCYGLKLLGASAMLRPDGWRFLTNTPAATVSLVAFAFSFILGIVLKNTTYSGGVSNNIILFQPTGWWIGLFAVYPLTTWVKRGNTWMRPAALAFLLLVGPLQSLPLFNLGYKIVLSSEFLAAMRQIKAEASNTDIVAFLPDVVQGEAILGAPETANNFYVAAFTGLRAYFTSRAYTENFSDPGPNGSKIYEDRLKTVKIFLSGNASIQDVKLLLQQGVRWMVLPGTVDVTAQMISSSHFPNLTVLKLGENDDTNSASKR
jgi:hypothetical protein